MSDDDERKKEIHFPLDLNSGAMDGDEDGMLFLLRNLVTLEDLWNPWKPKLAGIIVILYMVIEN